MKAYRRISSFLLGFVLLLAGLLKLMDPVGASLAVESYLGFLHLGFLRPASMFLAETLSFLETLVGIGLCCGVSRKIVALASGILMGAYSLLTLLVLVLNPSLDCGCFGEAIHLSHGWSFVKNLALCGLWCAAFLPWRDFGAPKVSRWVAFGLSCALCAGFGVRCLFTLPPVDFTGFAPGAEIGMDGDDTGFSICDADGEYRDSLLVDGAVLICAISDSSDVDLLQVGETLRGAAGLGIRPVAVSPLRLESLGEISYSADRRAIMSLCRSNGGFVYLFRGQIVSKWTASNPPSGEELSALLETNPTDHLLTSQRRARLAVEGGLGLLLLIMLAL